jgi:selenide,water dikinase
VREDLTLVQTVDFFTPVVDDPYTFGAIAAANALSDVYAMGGRPLTALSIAAIPEHDFPLEWAAAIMRGGSDALRAAGCALLGGHTVRDPEVKFGYAVTGLVDPARLLVTSGGRPGLALVLTKPLGTGIVATALKAGRAAAAVVEAASRSMARLNDRAAAAALSLGAETATDVTGFGLAGHGGALARASGIRLEIHADRIPLLPGARALAREFAPGGQRANRRQFEPWVEYVAEPEEELKSLLYDPQTSGGLLFLLPEDRLEDLRRELPEAVAIGRSLPAGPTPLRLV